MKCLILKPSYKDSKNWKTVIYSIDTNLILFINIESRIDIRTNFKNLLDLDVSMYTKYLLEINNNILDGLTTKDKTVLNLIVYSLLMNKDKKKIDINEYKMLL